jgi:NAD(P)-dependent dehydrogenase (short-subunit alcohol dehydrogenase family)
VSATTSDRAGAGTGKLAGRAAVITGGSSGIGRATAELFAREGASVMIGSPEADACERVVDGIRRAGGDAEMLVCDVTDSSQVLALLETARDAFGRLDVLYGNAGVLECGTAPDTSEETWRRVLDTNLTGNFHLAKHGVPMLAGGGAVVFTASELGLVGASECVAYCAAKGGLINMTRALAIDCAPLGIRVNCIAPGPVGTGLLQRFFDSAPDPRAMEERQTQPILLKRIGEPEEIAKAALHLAGDDSSYTTGSVMVVDGGATCWYGL